MKRLSIKVYKADICLRENELRMLQSQMDPHFLINLLTTININCLLRDEKETADALEHLNRFLSAQLLNTMHNTFVKLEDELNLVRDYLSLQKIRFADVFSFCIEVTDNALLECVIPRLSLQPLVENAIVHGFSDTTRDGCVRIDVSSDEKDLVIVVSDNGRGFDVSEAFSNSQQDQPQERRAIGIRNTDKRIKLLYGSSYGLFIQSVIRCGTTITLRLPIVYAEEMGGKKDVSSYDC